jgi:hypothetical protein
MHQSNKFNSLFPKLIEVASTSTINSKLAAVIVKGNKMLSRPCPNTERNTCRGLVCGSLHAEAHAILNYYGRELSHSPKLGWCFLPRKKGKEDKE